MSQASDTFVGTGALSASWSNVVGAASRVAGKVTPTIAPAAYDWNAVVFTPDQFVEVTLTGLPGSQVMACARVTAPGPNGYCVVASASGTLSSYRQDSGALTLLEGLSGYTFVLGDEIGCEVVGSRIRIFYNGSWQGAGATDTRYPTAGAPGFQLGALTDTIDFWEAQDVIIDTIGLPTLMQNTGWLALLTM